MIKHDDFDRTEADTIEEAKDRFDVVMRLRRCYEQIERLEFTILDNCCTCGAGENDKCEHDTNCIAVQMIDATGEDNRI